MAKDISIANGIDGAGSIYMRVIGATQAPPYIKPLPYTSRHILTHYAYKTGYSSYGGMANAGATKGAILAGPYQDEDAQYVLPALSNAQNKALSKFYAELDSAAMVAVNYAERAQAANMMVGRVKQLYDFGKAMRKFDLISASKALSLNADATHKVEKALSRYGKGKRSAKDVGAAWLEYHFGWEPLVHDIFNAIKVLDTPMSGKTIEARVSEKLDLRLVQTSGGETTERLGKGFAIVKLGATLQVTDTNLYLSNRLGLTNPAAIVWELVPYSFVIDWFSTVGEYINQWTDLQGVTVVDPWHSRTVVLDTEYKKKYPPLNWKMQVLSHGVVSRRFLGIPSFTIKMRPLKRLSLVRAATAIALLLGVMPKG